MLRESSLKGKHILTIKQFTPLELQDIFTPAYYMRRLVERNGGVSIFQHRILGEIFFEPSTPTTTSFDSAMKRLGGQTVILNESYSSTQKGESLEDTIRTVASYTDAIVLCYPNEEAPKIASNISPVPIINGGNGDKEHPTQAMIDFFTIREELGNPWAGYNLHRGSQIRTYCPFAMRTPQNFPSDHQLLLSVIFGDPARAPRKG